MMTLPGWWVVGESGVVEKGRDILSNTLGRNDPWASRRTCGDPGCDPCKTRMWLKLQKKEARKQGKALPDVLMTSTATQCRREGCNYSLQCIDCALGGVRACYWGESSRSARKRTQEHRSGAEVGLVSAPMVQHAVEVHGGRPPNYITLVVALETSPLYRACRESIQIASIPLWT